MKEPVYEVFARKSREDPLHHIGFVNASSDELAGVYAWKTYDEQNWFEMCLVPRSALIAVNRLERRAMEPAGDAGDEREEVPTRQALHGRGSASYGGSEVVTDGVAVR